MSDTIQGITWALEQSCPLRSSGDWKDPRVAAAALGDVQFCATMLRKPRSELAVFDGICITAWTSASPYPADGYVMGRKLAWAGGMESVEGLCRNCPANTGPGSVAGCSDWFYWPFDSKADERLRQIVRELRLEQRIKDCFPTMKRLWFAFWMDSPLSANSTETLHLILSTLLEQEERERFEPEKLSHYSDFKALKRFVNGLQRSLTHNLPMHVRFAPPGHADFGWLTTFPHCPRCKAIAPVKLWSGKYPVAPVTCGICGNTYSPAATASSKRDEPEDDDLRKALGQDAFEKFAVRYLVAKGAFEADAVKTVAEVEEEHRQRAESLARKQEFFRKQKLFLEEAVFAGLANQRTPEESAAGERWTFSAADFFELLKRCEKAGIDVFYIHHVSDTEEQNQMITVKHDKLNAIEVFNRMRQQGLEERFRTNLGAPEAMVNEWWDKRPGRS